jgi:hypothetical protein
MPAGICSQRETHYSVLGKTHKRYLVAEEFGELLQLRETFAKAMVVLLVDDELKAEGRREGCRPRRRHNLIAGEARACQGQDPARRDGVSVF